MRIVRTLAGTLAACGMVGAAVAGAFAANGTAASDDATDRVASGGMYGELAGGAAPTGQGSSGEPAARAGASDASAVEEYASGGTRCSMYANTSGMGSYCSSGDGVYRPLIERFPHLKFENCRYDDPPAGVDVPRNPMPTRQQWQLRSCLTGIDWLTYDGGDDRRFTVDLVLIDRDDDTTYDETALSRFLWNSVQTTYPIPMLQVEPRHMPVVGQRAYFTFDWLNGETHTPVSQGPYAGARGGGPYVEHRNRGMVMRAHAATITIDPQIKGVEPFDCTVADLGYDERQSPSPEDQNSDCHHVFTRSSAAAEDVSTAETGEPDAYQLRIDVRWDVEYGDHGPGFRPLGSYHMVVYQDLPVQDVQVLNVPVPDGDLG